MNVLVVEDDRTTRFLLKRALSNELACTITEAVDGLEGLAKLKESHFGLVVLDVQMPRLDGVETLRRIRANPETRSTPVVILTAERTDTVVRQIVELGVLDYMTKPLTSSRITERVRRVLNWLAASSGQSPSRFLAEGLSLLDSNPKMLVLDGDDGYREFFAGTLGGERTVLQARSGVEGLKCCVDARPEVVFVGDGLGILGEALFVRKVRANPVLQQMQLVALVDRSKPLDRATHQEGYNNTIDRALDAEQLLSAVKALLRPAGGGLTELCVVHPALREAVVSGAEQVFGMMLGTDVELKPVAEGVPAERLVAQQRGMWAVNTPGVEFRLYCDAASGRAMAGHLVGLDPAMVTDEDIESAVGEVFNMVSGRLRTTLANKGVSMEFELPEVFRTKEAVPADQPNESMNFCFRSQSGNLEFWLVLRTDPQGAAAATA